MRYVIIGAGAVGATIGGRLYEAGHETVLVARGAHYTALRDRGLRLTLPERALALPVPVADHPEAVRLRPDDVLVLSVKSQDTVAALDAWAWQPVAGGGTAATRLPVVCAQNGVGNEAVALRRFRTVYGMCVWLPASYLEPGAVVASAAPLTGMLHLGRFPAAGGAADPVLRTIAADLENSGFAAPLPADVMAWKYAKLLSNLGNALEAVTGPVRGEAALGLLARARAEGEAVLAAAGISHPDEAEEARVRDGLVTPQQIAGKPRQGGSSWQSLARGAGSIEADHLNGEIVLLGRTHGVRTPVNEVLQAVADDFARRGMRPGELSATRLTSLVRELSGS
ncbi:2-dehydropantoate 2-reductase N-terminal domain-containing protein [Streptomyces sp. SL13]|uniref:2-dehydropantoate 2-reductase N-terminal domain-containing protein n=1 Tax=Streptantibioticus silvisoli TaxID=2705255 RepID=A0AA90H324_9ACTN|nr:2-dehydropantoate 2-reductase N-terminal domain-containing protein [Streptantibioticus silvisoli]MDI5969829.1 2-dehydropantoate 2-reductase N-terminal domain-containing protein [Streptantibioticus silvisoli]